MVGPIVAGIIGSFVGGVMVYGLQLTVDSIREEMKVREGDDKPENVEIRSWLVRVEVEVKEMMYELEWLRGLLQHAAAIAVANDKRMRACVGELREIVFQVEDCIESRSKDIKSGNISLLEDLANQLSDVNRNIGQLKKRYEEYGVKDLVGKTSPFFDIQQQLVQSYCHVRENDLVDFIIIPNQNQIPPFMVSKLIMEEPPVVSICGMNGSGKTTLAKITYHDQTVQNNFELFAWVYVPRDFKRRDIWESVLFQIFTPDEVKSREEIAGKKDEELAEMIYMKLKEKRGLVVLDDIRSIDDWRIISAAFPQREWSSDSFPVPTRSKIFLTSCNQGVAEIVHPEGFILELLPLDEWRSWELFLKKMKVWSLGDARKEKIAREMVNYCQGLPMGIVVVADVLRSNNFEAVYQDFLSFLRKGRDDKGQKLFDALASSYYSLPQHLQPCFLYMGLFPSGYDISVERLINLWVAEGIVMPKLGQAERLEDVAHRYLSELVQRSMIQVNKSTSETDSYGRSKIVEDSIARIKTCRLHNLMRDLCFLLAKRERFFECIDVKSKTLLFGANEESSPYQPIRRIALYLNNLVVEVEGEYPSARSIIGFPLAGDTHINQHSLEFIVYRFRLLRVLDLDRVKGFILTAFHDFYDVLTHLRYLNLDSSSADWFLTHKLTATLLTLIFSGTTQIAINGDLRNLKNLRHLYLPMNYELIESDDHSQDHLQLGNLKDLQTLMNLDVSTAKMEDLTKLPSLRQLGVFIYTSTAFTSFNNLINNADQVIKSLQSLTVILGENVGGEQILGESIKKHYPQLSVTRKEGFEMGGIMITYSIA